MKNLVYIETFNRFGSGILFPCRCGEKNTYIIVTNYHVIRDLKANGEDKKQEISLEFYDMFGKKVDEEFIKAVYVEYASVCDNESDIAVLLVELEDSICIPSQFENEILWGDFKEENIYSSGYPNVLLDDDINRRLIIEGKIENTFPIMKRMGIYKITDNYHFYMEMSDRDLFEGFSGGPVYVSKGEKKCLVGMNQSLCNVGDGSNPFKLAYFIRIRQVFEHLSENGILLYEFDDGKIEIEWLKELEQQEEKQIDVLILGGSGAGKSSFVKELMFHGNNVDASGDGQTTRMDVVYKLGLCCDKPNIKIIFLNKNEFIKKMESLTSLNRIAYVFQTKYYFPCIDLEEDLLGYLRIVYAPLEELRKCNESGKDLFDVSLEKEMERILNMISLGIRKGDEAEREEISDLYKEILELFEVICNSSDDKSKLTAKKIGAIFRMDWQESYRKWNHQKNELYEDGELDLENYIRFILDSDQEQVEKFCNKVNQRQDLLSVLNQCRGYFDIREFYHLFSEEEQNEYFAEYADRYKDCYEMIPLERKNDDEISNVKSVFQEYYGQMYDRIWERVKECYEIGTSNKYDLTRCNEYEKEIIGLCLKVKEGKSLTSIVKQIEIEDVLSGKYALMIKRCGITNIRLLDTCGLDHIERGTGIKRYMLDKFLEYEEKYNFKAIFYIKKLDSGKPVELERMLPIIYSIVPEHPIFTIFTGADVFYAGREEILMHFEWNEHLYELEKKNEKMRMPKSVAYFYESENIVNAISCSEERRKILHRVMTENLIPFVSDTDNREYTGFARNNRKYMKKLLEAILLDEWNTGYIDEIEILQELKKEEFKQALDEDILRMFWEASLYDWRYRHHMTVNANVKRILGQVKNDEYMGYNGTYLDRWDVLLREGYQKAFLEGESQVVDKLFARGISKNQIESMFAKLKNEILTGDMKYRKLPVNVQESEFRKIFRRMYEEGEYYHYNPYQGDNVLDCLSIKREYLKEVCNFQTGLQNERIKIEFRNLFISKIKKYTEEENKKRIKRLLKYKSRFRNKVKDVINDMYSFSGINNNEYIIEMFKVMLEENEE